MKKFKKVITAYCIAFENCLDIRYIRKTKNESISAFVCDDSDRMGWNYHKRNSNAFCIKILIKKLKWENI